MIRNYEIDVYFSKHSRMCLTQSEDGKEGEMLDSILESVRRVYGLTIDDIDKLVIIPGKDKQ